MIDEDLARRESLMAGFVEECLAFFMATTPTKEQVEFWEHFVQAEAAAKVLLEREPRNPTAQAFREQMSAWRAQSRERYFRLARVPDTGPMLRTIGGKH